MSNIRNESQGGTECSAIRTGSSTVMDGASFEESVFNTTNPITINITEWVCNGGSSIFYMYSPGSIQYHYVLMYDHYVKHMDYSLWYTIT